MTFRKYFYHFLLTISFVLILTSCNFPSSKQQRIEKSLPSLDVQTAIESAFMQQKELVKDEEIVFTLFDIQLDHLQFSEDQKIALVWFALIDPATQNPAGTEPGMAIATQVSTPADLPEAWKITFQHQEDWSTTIWNLPDSLLNSEEKQRYTGKTQAIPHSSQVYTGYKLPWPQGMPVKLSGSIAHVYIYKTCPTTCLYAFDFWNGEMFPVSAAKAGTVKKAVWEYPNGNTTNTNYILIEDTTTTPTTYQIYYHLAQDSIPVALRTPGAAVYQGQFIGNADDTGASTAHHLHFMVHTNPSSYWGSSVDIVFDEVTINSGRPRTCVEANSYPEYGSQCISGDWFVSQNAEEYPPTITVSAPTDQSVITTETFQLTATASDDTGIQTIEAFIRQGEEGWSSLATVSNTATFSQSINVCELNFTDTQIGLAFDVTDLSGKVTSTKSSPITVVNQYSCEETPPEQLCTPSANEIAIFSQVEYLGSCAKLAAGNYYGFNETWDIENDQIQSIQVGSNVYAVAYTDTNLKGFQETFTASDPDLTDNTIGINTISSLLVSTYPAIPNPPTLPASFTATEEDRLGIAWLGNAESYYASLSLNGEIIRTKDWSAEKYWELGALTTGEYEFQVIAKNISGTAQSSFTFSISAVQTPFPQVELNPLAAITSSTQINLSWSVPTGDDNIQNFVLQYRMNAETEWLLLTILEDATARSFETYGQPGNTYEFRMRATALNGEAEDWSSQAITRTTLQTTCQSDVYESADTSLSAFETASILVLGESQTHNFCGVGDVDWVVFSSEKTQKSTLELITNQASTPIKITLMDQTGITALQSVTLNAGDKVDMRLSKGSVYYLKFEPSNALLSGTDTNYEFIINPVEFNFWAGFYIFLVGIAASLIKYFGNTIHSKKK